MGKVCKAHNVKLLTYGTLVRNLYLLLLLYVQDLTIALVWWLYCQKVDGQARAYGL